MIWITRLNGKEMVINANHIETIEATPDTTITMTTGHKVIATESVDEVIDKVIAYSRKIFSHEYKE